MKGAIRRTFRDGFDISISPFSPRITHLFDSVFIFYRNIVCSVLNRKLDHAHNGMLVTPTYAINSSIYDNIDFAGLLAKVEISGVIKITTQLLAMACILPVITSQKGVL